MVCSVVYLRILPFFAPRGTGGLTFVKVVGGWDMDGSIPRVEEVRKEPFWLVFTFTSTPSHEMPLYTTKEKESSDA